MNLELRKSGIWNLELWRSEGMKSGTQEIRMKMEYGKTD
jgi:hypothetical protein